MNSLKVQTAGKQSATVPGPAAVVDAGNQPSLEIGSLRRWILLLVGLMWVLVAAVGVVLPGIPTAGPLILASICLTKSCPWLEQRLVRNRFFSPFHRYLDGNAEMPWRAKIAAMLMMWTAISVSGWMLWNSPQVPHWVVGVLLLSGVIGTVVIARFRRHNVAADPRSSLD